MGAIADSGPLDTPALLSIREKIDDAPDTPQARTFMEMQAGDFDTVRKCFQLLERYDRQFWRRTIISHFSSLRLRDPKRHEDWTPEALREDMVALSKTPMGVAMAVYHVMHTGLRGRSKELATFFVAHAATYIVVSRFG